MIPSERLRQLHKGRFDMTSTIRFCDHCEASANDTDINCRQCGSVLPPSSYDSVEQVNSINWWKWIIGFDGRINRSGLIVRVLILWGSILGPSAMMQSDSEFMASIGVLAFLAALVLGFPMYMCGLVRRFHDRGKSGWSLLGLLIPFLNLVFGFELYFLSGDPTSNEFGAPPVGLRIGY